MLNIFRKLETKRAPSRADSYSGNYVPSGIDIYTTTDPELVSFKKNDKYAVRVTDLLAMLDELDRFESRKLLAGEKIEIDLEMVIPDDAKGDVYHQSGFINARPGDEHPGLVCLDIYSGHSFGSISLTADRDSLRQALEDRHELARMEQEDQKRYQSDATI